MKDKKAFTLVELLVVISIIALLLAVLMPALSKAKQQAYRIVCTSLQKTFGTANATYAAANNGKYVPFSQATTRPPEDELNGYWDERWAENREFRNAIAANRVKNATNTWSDPYIFPKELRCPAHKISDKDEDLYANWKTSMYMKNFLGTYNWPMVMSFAMNTERWVGATNDAVAWMPSDRKYRGHTAARIKKPSSCMVFIESNYYQTRYERGNWTKYWAKFGDVLAATPLPGNWAQIAYRHMGRADVVYFDGHVKSLTNTEVYNTKNPSNDYNPNSRKPDLLWDAEYPMVGSRGNGI